MRRILSLCLAVSIFSGCGYTRQTVLPRGMKTLYVETFGNQIPLEAVYAYEPGVEIKITNAIIRRLHRDGNLRVVPREEADVVLKGDLVEFNQEGLRFTGLERVEEFRLYVVVGLSLVDRKTEEVIWNEPNFSGDASYFVSGSRASSLSSATDEAVDRLARNVVDRITEDW